MSTSPSASRASYVACRRGTENLSPNSWALCSLRLPTATRLPVFDRVIAAARVLAMLPVPRIPHASLPVMKNRSFQRIKEAAASCLHWRRKSRGGRQTNEGKADYARAQQQSAQIQILAH